MKKPLRVKFTGDEKYGEAYLGFAKKKLAQFGKSFTEEAGDEIWSRTIDLEDGGKIILMGGVEQDHITIVGPPTERKVAKLEIPEIHTPVVEIPEYVPEKLKQEYLLFRDDYVDGNETVPVEFYVGCLFRGGDFTGYYAEEYVLLYKVDFSQSVVQVDLSKPDYRVVDRGPVPEGLIKSDLTQILDTYHDSKEFQIIRLAEKTHDMYWHEYNAYGVPVPIEAPYNGRLLGNGCPNTFESTNYYRSLKIYINWEGLSCYEPWVRPGLLGRHAGITSDNYYSYFDTGYPQFSTGLLVRHCGLIDYTMYNHRMDDESVIMKTSGSWNVDMSAGNIILRPQYGDPSNPNNNWDAAGRDQYGLPPSEMFAMDMAAAWQEYYETKREVWTEFSMTPAQGLTEPWYGGSVDKVKYPLIYGRANFWLGEGWCWDFVFPYGETVHQTGFPQSTYTNGPSPYGATPRSWVIGFGMYEDEGGKEHWGTTRMEFYEPSAAFPWAGEHIGWRERRDTYFALYGGPCLWDRMKECVEERERYGDAIPYKCLFADNHGPDPGETGNDYLGEIEAEGHFVKVLDTFVKFPKVLPDGQTVEEEEDNSTDGEYTFGFQKYNEKWEMIND